MSWFKQRSKFGKWMDEQDYTQKEFSQASGVSQDTITKACADDNWMPSPIVVRKIMNTVKKLDPSIKDSSEFWKV